MQPLNIGTEKAFQKIKFFCAYQERSHAETRDKLYGFGLYKHEVEEMIALLIDENYLNEERFAIAFAGGKFRMKSWGRIKIKYELKGKGVSEYNVKKALASLDQDEYEKTILKLWEEKSFYFRSEKNTFTKKKKIYEYLLQKGFESSLINDILKGEK